MRTTRSSTARNASAIKRDEGPAERVKAEAPDSSWLSPIARYFGDDGIPRRFIRRCSDATSVKSLLSVSSIPGSDAYESDVDIEDATQVSPNTSPSSQAGRDSPTLECDFVEYGLEIPKIHMGSTGQPPCSSDHHEASPELGTLSASRANLANSMLNDGAPELLQRISHSMSPVLDIIKPDVGSPILHPSIENDLDLHTKGSANTGQLTPDSDHQVNEVERLSSLVPGFTPDSISPDVERSQGDRLEIADPPDPGKPAAQPTNMGFLVFEHCSSKVEVAMQNSAVAIIKQEYPTLGCDAISDRTSSPETLVQIHQNTVSATSEATNHPSRPSSPDAVCDCQMIPAIPNFDTPEQDVELHNTIRHGQYVDSRCPSTDGVKNVAELEDNVEGGREENPGMEYDAEMRDDINHNMENEPPLGIVMTINKIENGSQEAYHIHMPIVDVSNETAVGDTQNDLAKSADAELPVFDQGSAAGADPTVEILQPASSTRGTPWEETCVDQVPRAGRPTSEPPRVNTNPHSTFTRLGFARARSIGAESPVSNYSRAKEANNEVRDEVQLEAATPAGPRDLPVVKLQVQEERLETSIDRVSSNPLVEEYVQAVFVFVEDDSTSRRQKGNSIPPPEEPDEMLVDSPFPEPDSPLTDIDPEEERLLEQNMIKKESKRTMPLPRRGLFTTPKDGEIILDEIIVCTNCPPGQYIDPEPVQQSISQSASARSRSRQNRLQTQMTGSAHPFSVARTSSRQRKRPARLELEMQAASAARRIKRPRVSKISQIDTGSVSSKLIFPSLVPQINEEPISDQNGHGMSLRQRSSGPFRNSERERAALVWLYDHYNGDMKSVRNELPGSWGRGSDEKDRLLRILGEVEMEGGIKLTPMHSEKARRLIGFCERT
ncbi:hypothetical protein QBC43DRAFT_100226 [Cladorrhinum sp. PSN259]|nr:hypothetical protein QBC43DRAFT_100226 [Cladorrhinum sp. PSN259]